MMVMMMMMMMTTTTMIMIVMMKDKYNYDKNITINKNNSTKSKNSALLSGHAATTDLSSICISRHRRRCRNTLKTKNHQREALVGYHLIAFEDH